jgi:hypothetical protein
MEKVVFERIEGLVNVNDLKELLMLINKVSENLKDESFDEFDIEMYLGEIIKKGMYEI